MGNDESDVSLVISELTKNNIINDVPFSSFVGFHIPEEAGTYRVRIYVQGDKGYNFENYDYNNMYLVYIHKEKKSEWVKLFNIKSEL